MPDHDPDIERWPPPELRAAGDAAMPGWDVVIWRGMCARCPRCGAGPIFAGYLKVRPACLHCAAALGAVPADDAPLYVAMVVVLQIYAVIVVLFFKGVYRPGILADTVCFLLLAMACAVTLRLAKGAIIGILLKLGLKREVLNGTP